MFFSHLIKHFNNQPTERDQTNESNVIVPYITANAKNKLSLKKSQHVRLSGVAHNHDTENFISLLTKQK